MINKKLVLYAVAAFIPMLAIAIIYFNMNFSIDDGNYIRLFGDTTKSALILIGAVFISFNCIRAAHS
ncbi:hypothetical protein [Vibrio sp. 10N.239.312.D08]|uniref:hypothetical protein n=1 Tax=Vibrio sp. 10N.239.312.D08 TaxID=3229978 RepID=UPI00354DE6A5